MRTLVVNFVAVPPCPGSDIEGEEVCWRDGGETVEDFVTLDEVSSQQAAFDGVKI